MNEEKVNNLINELVGLKYYEWIKLSECVEKEFSHKKSRLEIDNPDNLRENMKNY